MVYGSHGIRLLDSSDAIIENLNVHDTGDVGISANMPVRIFIPKGDAQAQSCASH